MKVADDASGDYVTTSDGQRIVDHENMQRSRLRADARKWTAARLAPKKYGDHISHDVRGQLPAGDPYHRGWSAARRVCSTACKFASTSPATTG
jgi:hypothetical protein